MFRSKQHKIKSIKEYQQKIDDVEARSIPKELLLILYVILLFIVFTIGWAFLAKVDRVVVSSGKIVPLAPNLVIQPLTTSIVRKIHVRVGDVVEKNKVLVTLDPTFANADVDQLKKQLTSLNVQLKRVAAELDEKLYQYLETEGTSGKLQLDLFTQRQLTYQEKQNLFKQKLLKVDSQLKSNINQQDGILKKKKIVREIEGVTAKSPQIDNEYKLRILEIQKEQKRLDANLGQVKSNWKILKNNKQVIKVEQKLWKQEWRKDLFEKLVALNQEKDSVVKELSKATRLNDLVQLRAPADGVVQDIALRYVGSVIRQAEQLITLVPINTTMEAEVKLKAKDRGRIRVGDLTRIKLLAFPFQRHGTILGSVRVISEDAFQQTKVQLEATNAGTAYYSVRISLDHIKLKDVPKDFRLVPGMEVISEIKIGHRSIISYFLYPILRVLDESIREP